MKAPNTGPRFLPPATPNNTPPRPTIAELDKAHAFAGKIVTKVEPLQAFYRAEPYHQDYATLHPSSPYIAVYDLPKIANLKKLYPEIYREQAVLVGDNQPVKRGTLTMHRRDLLSMMASAAAAVAVLPARLRAEAEEFEVTKIGCGMAAPADAGSVSGACGRRTRNLPAAARCFMSIARVYLFAPAASCRFSGRRPSSRAGRAGRVSGVRSKARWAPRLTGVLEWNAPRCIAGAAAGILATSLTTARRRPVCAIA